MKRILFATLLATLVQGALATEVGVSISVGDPGFYGRIDLGQVAPPMVVYRQPMLVQPGAWSVAPQPIYLRVPPGHRKHWRRHCAEYGACGQPVYFVQERWYRDSYRGRHEDRGGDRGSAPRNRGNDDHGQRGHGQRDHGRHDQGRGNGRD